MAAESRTDKAAPGFRVEASPVAGVSASAAASSPGGFGASPPASSSSTACFALMCATTPGRVALGSRVTCGRRLHGRCCLQAQGLEGPPGRAAPSDVDKAALCSRAHLWRASPRARSPPGPGAGSTGPPGRAAWRPHSAGPPGSSTRRWSASSAGRAPSCLQGSRALAIGSRAWGSQSPQQLPAALTGLGAAQVAQGRP